MKGIWGPLRRKNAGPPGTRRTLSFHLSLGNDPPALAIHKPYTNRTCSRKTARWSGEKRGGTNTLGSHLSPSPASEKFRWWVALILSHDFSDLYQSPSQSSLFTRENCSLPWNKTAHPEKNPELGLGLGPLTHSEGCQLVTWYQPLRAQMAGSIFRTLSLPCFWQNCRMKCVVIKTRWVYTP